MSYWKLIGAELICPYCGEEQETANYNKNDICECTRCQKKFEFRTEYSPVFYVREV